MIRPSNRQTLDKLGKNVKTYLFILISLNTMSVTKATDPESMKKEKSFLLSDLFSINGNLKFGGGYLSNNQYGENGFYSTISFQPQIAIRGVPVDLSWNVVKPPHGMLQFGHFNIGFSKSNFQNFLENQKLESLDIANVDSLWNLEEVQAKLSEMDYLQMVSESNKEFIRLQKDSLLGKTSAIDAIRMDSLRQVVAEYDKLNKRFHELKTLNKTKSLKVADSTQIDLTSSQKKIENTKGVAKSISDSLKTIDSINTLTHIQRVFMRFEKISLGYDVLDYSRLSVVGYPYIGGAVDYNYKGLLTGFAAGKHSPYYSSTTGALFSNEFVSDANMAHLKLGIGDNENNTILSVIDFSRQNHSANFTNTAETAHERVWTILSRKKLGEYANFQLEISKSSKPDKVSEDGKQLNEIAFSALTTHELPQLNARVKFEYENIGERFHTPGNPYLSTGYQLLNFGINKSIFNGIVSGDMNVIQSWKNPGIETTPDWKRFSISLLMRARISKTIQTSFRHYTNKFYSGIQIIGGEQITSSNQVTFVISPGKIISMTLSALTGKSQRDLQVYSRNYLGTSSISVKHSKGALTLQANYYVTVTTSEMRNITVTIGDRFQVGKRLNVRGAIGANLNEASNSSILNYGFGYQIANRLMLDLSGSYNSYYANDGLVPSYSSFQTQGGFNYNF